MILSPEAGYQECNTELRETHTLPEYIYAEEQQCETHHTVQCTKDNSVGTIIYKAQSAVLIYHAINKANLNHLHGFYITYHF